MDSINKATELQNLLMKLNWVIPEVKGVDSSGKRRSYCQARKLEIVNVTEAATHPLSPHPTTLRLTASYRGNDGRVANLNDKLFLDALAVAITKNLPSLLDEALESVREQGISAVKKAEEDLENQSRKIAALRRSPELQQELIV